MCHCSAEGSAFDAFNIRTSELLFILRWKVRVSQPGQIAQGKFHFPFVGPPAFMCGVVPPNYHKGRRLTGLRHRLSNGAQNGEVGGHLPLKVLGNRDRAWRKASKQVRTDFFIKHCCIPSHSLSPCCVWGWSGNLAMLPCSTGLALLLNKSRSTLGLFAL